MMMMLILIVKMNMEAIMAIMHRLTIVAIMEAGGLRGCAAMTDPCVV